MIFCDQICFENAFITLNYVEVCFDDVSWVSNYAYEIGKWDMFCEFYELWKWNVVEQCMNMKAKV